MEPSLAAAAAVDPQSQPQQAPPLPYDPSQLPSYDPYYSYYVQSQPAFDPHYPQPYADPSQYRYYSHDYSAYVQPPAPAYHVPAPQSLPLGAPPPAAVDPSANSLHEDPENPHAASPGVNPAAAAAIKALSELSQFAERMDVEERARVGMMGAQWHERSRGMVAAYGAHDYGVQQYPVDRGSVPMHMEIGGRKQRGHGRRGGGPSRGGGSGRGRGNVNPIVSGPDGRAPSFRGRGRGGRGGRGRGRHGAATGKELSSAQASGPMPAALKHPIIPVAWCDICRVDCNSLEILEQHKNGKRHKKTVQKMEEMQARQRLLEELRAKNNQEKLDVKVEQPNIPMESKQEVSEQPNFVDAQQSDVHNVKDATAADGVTDVEQPNENAEKSEVGNLESSMEVQLSQGPMRPMRGGYGRSRPFRGGMMRLGRGGKRLRYFNLAPARPPKRPRETPLFCNICNVTCDTQAVFERHLAGKKHLSKIRRFPGQGVAFVYTGQHPGTQNMHVVDGDGRPKDASGAMPPESSNLHNAPADVAQVITGMDPRGDKAVKECATEMGNSQTLVSGHLGADCISKDDLPSAGTVAADHDDFKDDLPSAETVAPAHDNSNDNLPSTGAVAPANDNPKDGLSSMTVASVHSNSKDDLSNVGSIAPAHANSKDDLPNAETVAPAHDNSKDDLLSSGITVPAQEYATAAGEHVALSGCDAADGKAEEIC